MYCLLLTIWSGTDSFSQGIRINHDSLHKVIFFGNEALTLTLDYNKKANISSMTVRGHQVIQSTAGIFSNLRTKQASYSSLDLTSDPVISISGNSIRLSGIQFGDRHIAINETWIFSIHPDKINFNIDRTLSKNLMVEKTGFPVFMFQSMDTWEGAYQDYGGLAWFYLFNKRQETYGVHSYSSRFWNSKTGAGLNVEVGSPGMVVALDYSRTMDDQLAFNVALSEKEIKPRFDSGTFRRRFVRDTTDVWSAIQIKAGKTSQHITLSAFDYNEVFGRGQLIGVNQNQVNAVLNTIARIGVIDKEHFGGNSWHTPYGPICLHEQYIAQLGIAINDPAYLKGYQQCLDYYRDHAIKPDGRVWPRWAYTNEDAMPNEYTDKGFYEAQWGYLLDANPDLVTNVSELYDQTGDLAWVKKHQLSCEKALDWILKRDVNGNGLVEMMTDNHKQKRGSDWIDIIWASYENAFVNAKLYHALILWSDIERQLGNAVKEKYYKHWAGRLKTSFNKSTMDGGFWDEEKKCYIHWKDKDGSVHGNNMVTPVNFMAIAYGICTDSVRIKTMLDNIEIQMQKENLFFWPLCMQSYAPGEGNDWQFPFPNYENGDIFLSWGAVGVKAYSAYKPELALKYVRNVLAQYAKDGLAFQRYGRMKQDGLGDDILSGNCLSVVGLYQAIYGINPLYNRLHLDPHITKELEGTQVNYTYRNQQLTINLDMDKFAVSNNQFKIIANKDFGFFSSGNELLYFNEKSNQASLKLTALIKGKTSLEIEKWGEEEMSFIQRCEGSNQSTLIYQVKDLKPNANYTILGNEKTLKRIRSSASGRIEFELKSDRLPVEIRVLKK
jgi:GH43 family beta-xylosidase